MKSHNIYRKKLISKRLRKKQRYMGRITSFSLYLFVGNKFGADYMATGTGERNS